VSAQPGTKSTIDLNAPNGFSPQHCAKAAPTALLVFSEKHIYHIYMCAPLKF
jgi:hypothetical protein